MSVTVGPKVDLTAVLTVDCLVCSVAGMWDMKWGGWMVDGLDALTAAWTGVVKALCLAAKRAVLRVLLLDKQKVAYWAGNLADSLVVCWVCSTAEHLVSPTVVSTVWWLAVQSVLWTATSMVVEKAPTKVGHLAWTWVDGRVYLTAECWVARMVELRACPSVVQLVSWMAQAAAGLSVAMKDGNLVCMLAGE